MNNSLQFIRGRSVSEDDFHRLIFSLKETYGSLLSLSRSVVESGISVELELDAGSVLKSPEGYIISGSKDAHSVSALSRSGLFYGAADLIRSLYFSSSYATAKKWTIEEPAFQYRGMLLDCSRHFVPVPTIKKFLRLLSVHRMNYFHWHLTDDQGWRIEIEKYPRLIEIGSRRINSDGTIHEGYYSKQDIRDVVEYSKSLHITVIPEIEMPGHALSALAGYPELSCSGGPFTLSDEWGIYDDVYCAGKESVFTFIQNVLSEAAELFPSQYIHIGGDECPVTRWDKCPDCRKRLTETGGIAVHDLYGYFLRRVKDIVEGLGKRMIGWDEILIPGGIDDTASTIWHNDFDAGKMTGKYVDYILCPMKNCYFDYAQAGQGEPKSFDALLTLEQVYAFDPVDFFRDYDLNKRVIGGQGNVWTEYIESGDHLEYMTIPRICALAEKLWNKAPGTLTSFQKSLKHRLNILGKLGYNYRELD